MASILDARDRVAHRNRLFRLAVLQVALHKLSFEHQQVIYFRYIERLTLKDAANYFGTTVARFRTRQRWAIDHLRTIICEIELRIETRTARRSIMVQWGDVRPSLHWVPDDENEQCNCSKCKRQNNIAKRAVVPVPHFPTQQTLEGWPISSLADMGTIG